MDVLIRYGFSIEEIKNMMDTNTYINDVNNKDIEKLIEILCQTGCKKSHIKNIFICNPFLLNIKTTQIQNLISKLYEIGLEELYILFDSNPFILNMTIEDIDIIKNNSNNIIDNLLF